LLIDYLNRNFHELRPHNFTHRNLPNAKGAEILAAAE
jgi:hypothetical protein